MREPGYKLYDLYKVVNGKNVFVGRFDRKQMHEDYGLSVNNIPHDVKTQKSKPGKDGRYRIREVGEPVEPYEEPKSSGMPKHVSMIKTNGGCRFGG